jgi:CBS domain-containing protein
MRARELMTRPPVTCHVNDAMNVAARSMWECDCGSVLAVDDEGRLKGIITDRDICMAAYTRGSSLDSMLVHTAMASEPVCVRPDAEIDEIEELMAGHRVRRIPVIDNDHKPVGMVSMNDIARAVARQQNLHQGARSLGRTLAAICEPRPFSSNGL